MTFIARGAHLDAIRRNGFRVEGERGTIHIDPANATANPAEIGVVDLVLFCVKLSDVEAADEAIRPIVGGGRDFYIICPDNDVTRDIDNRRILYTEEFAEFLTLDAPFAR